ncbi:MAG: hypothetical protein P8Y93_13620, partial [Acidobacteriota bacterium]
LLVSGCASRSSGNHARTQAIQASQEIPKEQLLDVGITVFDPGLPPEGQPPPDDVFPELREAESRYLAIQLMQTMQITGQWGAVRVLPAGQGTTDLRVTGTILQSTGMKLMLDIRARDSRGEEWLDKRYKAEADALSYPNVGVSQHDPFQSLYNEISNDLLEVKRKLRQGEVQEIRQVSRLQFASDLAPEVFSGYLRTTKKGRTTVSRLPARGDPMMARADNIRASENLFIDALDQNYAVFFTQMEGPYTSWRKYTYNEEVAYKALKKKATMQKILGGLAVLGAVLTNSNSTAGAVARDAALIGGMAAIHAGVATSKEAKIHVEAIRELAASVESELQPIVIDVHGQTLRLAGSAETQYEEWRRLLLEIWTAETGLTADPNQPGAVAVEQTTAHNAGGDDQEHN